MHRKGSKVPPGLCGVKHERLMDEIGQPLYDLYCERQKGHGGEHLAYVRWTEDVPEKARAARMGGG
jgi:hypothetical protein